MTSSTPRQKSGAIPSLAGEDWLTANATQQLLGILETAGFEARIVGGAVRNALLCRPVSDLDIATTALPDDVMAVAEAAGLSVIPTGLQHGTVIVVIEGEAFEVTTLREDVATDGRHADVRFTTAWEADASRRDFTINALYCDARGTILDPLDGLKDLAGPEIRFIGNPNQRIVDDYLRVLRFFRFFAEYGKGDPNPDALAACVRGRHGLRQLSRERVRQEFLKLLAAPRAAAAIDVMHGYGLLGAFLPVAPRVQYFARLIGASPEASQLLRLAALSLATCEDAERISKALKLSNREQAALQNIAAVVHASGQPPTPAVARQLIYRHGRENFKERVCYLRCSSFRALAEPAWSAAAALARTWSAPPFPLAGKDILALGVEPGPKVGQILKQAEAEWLASDFAVTGQQLRAYVQDLVVAQMRDRET